MLRAGLQGTPSVFVIGLCTNAWRLAETYLIINRQMVKYLATMTMMMKLKASHYFCVQGVSCEKGHRRKGRNEFRYAAYHGSAPTGRIFATFSVGDFTKDSRENSALIEI
jgi:hypothetical protein